MCSYISIQLFGQSFTQILPLTFLISSNVGYTVGGWQGLCLLMLMAACAAKAPHPWYLKLQPWFLALSCVQLKHNPTCRHNLKCFCGFSWVCWSLVSLLKFPQGFGMKRGAGCFIALPWLPDHSSPLICQSWDAGANVKEQCKMLLCRQCMYKSAAAGCWNVVLWVYATSLQCMTWRTNICCTISLCDVTALTEHLHNANCTVYSAQCTGQPALYTALHSAHAALSVCCDLHPEKHDGRVSPQPGMG